MNSNKKITIVLLLLLSLAGWSQQKHDQQKAEEDSFWKRVHFGGGLQLGIGSSYTAIGISPSAIYDVSDKFSTGIGASYLYSKYKISNTSYNVYGASALVLYNPIKEIQLSSELEELNVNRNVNNTKDSYWLPAWYMGAAYSMGRNAAIGIRYDVLYDEKKSIYDSAFTPFVRVYF